MSAPSADYRGFRYQVSEEQIRWWMAVPAADKLAWLAEAQEFLWRTMTPESKEAMRRFRDGSL